jgi:4-amino-4-deoxy-L-arabinose transferase-like glycosyltransferase
VTPPAPRFALSAPRAVVAAACIGVIALRLPLLHLPAWADEAGFLEVGKQWRWGASGPYLYGDYWVDRPPLLITLYGAADRLGGLIALRLLGAAAAVITVFMVAWLARQVAGGKAAAWAAVTAAALLSTPYHWAFMVDGELLALPFVAAGLALALHGTRTPSPRGVWSMVAAGALAGAALLVKQNFADVFVFVFAALALNVLYRTIALRRASILLGAFLGGALALAGVAALWALAHGTSLHDIWYAAYGFRADAAATGVSTIAWSRLSALVIAAALSGLALVFVAVWVTAWPGQGRNATVHALLAVLAFDVVSIFVGGNYWLHYLLQPIVGSAALLGIVAARIVWLRGLAVACVLSSVVGTAFLVKAPPQTAEEMVGRAIAGAAAPGDSLVTVLGRANVNLAAGLASPYPYLWALPARSLDPRKDKLKTLLSSSGGPTWFVSWTPVPSRSGPESLAGVLREHYRPVARVCGRTIYLRNDLERPQPSVAPRKDATTASECVSVTRNPPILRGLT